MHLITAGTPEQFQGLFQPALTLSDRVPERVRGWICSVSSDEAGDHGAALSAPRSQLDPRVLAPSIGGQCRPVIRGAAGVGC